MINRTLITNVQHTSIEYTTYLPERWGAAEGEEVLCYAFERTTIQKRHLLPYNHLSHNMPHAHVPFVLHAILTAAMYPSALLKIPIDGPTWTVFAASWNFLQPTQETCLLFTKTQPFVNFKIIILMGQRRGLWSFLR